MKITRTGQFKKDYKRMVRQGKDVKAFRDVVELLSQKIVLPARYCAHKLSGGFGKCNGCHIGPDWVLIYRTNKEELILERMGSHSDLFG